MANGGSIKRENGAGAAWSLIRAIILLVAGLLGTFHETVIAKTPRPYLLLLFASMMGLASFARLDDIIAKRGVTTRSANEES